MDEIKNIIISIILLIILCSCFFVGGYLFCDRQAIKRIDEANRELTEQQRKYDELIRLTDERIRSIREQLSQQVSSSGEAAKELSGIIEQIKKQRITL